MSAAIILLVLLVLATSSGTFGWRSIYYRLLKRDLEVWRGNGWVSEAGAREILAANRPQGIGNRLISIVALLGALLMLFAVFSFIAANWDEMSRLARLTWLIALLWAVYIAGWRFSANALPYFAEAAYGLGVAIFGANIALVSQMFHLDGHPPAAVLMWTLGALATAFLLGSRTALTLAFAGTAAWTLMEIFGYDRLFHWPFLIVWGAAVLVMLRLRWWYAYHLAVQALLLFVVPTLIRLGIEAHWSAQGILASLALLSLLVIAGALWLQTSARRDELERFDEWLEKYGLVGLLVSLFVLQTLPQIANLAPFEVTNALLADTPLVGGRLGWLLPVLALAAASMVVLFAVLRSPLLNRRDLTVFGSLAAGVIVYAGLSSLPGLSSATFSFLSTWLYGAAFLGFILWLMTFGHRRHFDSYVLAALLAFAAEVLYIYASVFGSLLETSLFFFIGGLLTMALAYFLYDMRRRLDDAEPVEETR